MSRVEQAPHPRESRQWDETADIVVIGFGGSGATCAAEAAALGADVLVLEKAAEGGGNSVCVAGSLIMHSADDGQSLEYLDWLCGGQTEHEVLQAYIDGLKEVPAFEAELGFPAKEDSEPFRADGFFPEFPGAPGAGGLIGRSVIAAPGGAALWTAISGLALRRGARVSYGTRARRLIQDPVTGEILGVEAEQADGTTIAVKARRATVLAAGGFEFNDEMRRQYLTHCPVHFAGSPSLTGDGIAMAQRAGAKLWHMNSVAGPLYWGIKVDGDRVYATYDFMRMAGFGHSAGIFKDAGSVIWVNKHGQRFHDETTETGDVHHGYSNRATWLALDPEVPEFTNVPAFVIFDEKARAAGAVMTTLNSRTPPWSEDNRAELERGWIIRADTIEELAARCAVPEMPGTARAGHVPPAALAETVRAWNAQCENGKDDELGRELFLTPLDTPPFYAVGPMLPTYLNTHGGPKHDASQRVLDSDDQPIPRLYAVGECGSMWGPYYNSMGDITEFIVSGCNAARDAVKGTAWDEI